MADASTIKQTKILHLTPVIQVKSQFRSISIRYKIKYFLIPIKYCASVKVSRQIHPKIAIGGLKCMQYNKLKILKTKRIFQF